MKYLNSKKPVFYNTWRKEKSHEIQEVLFNLLSNQLSDSARGFIPQSWADFVGFDIPDVPYGDYSIRDTAIIRQIFALLQKNVDYAAATCEESAWETFCESEYNCKSTNDRFRNIFASDLNKSDYEGVLMIARKKIASILGDVPEYSDIPFAFGPGSSTTVKIKTTARYKLESSPICSFVEPSKIEKFWSANPQYFIAHKCEMSTGLGQLSFVPKNRQTHRSILVEPTLNTYVQKGIGTIIRERLKVCGIDLSDQTLNQRRAREGSLHNNYATIDLRSASDTISHNVVLELLPFNWFCLLDDWRSKRVSYKRKGKKTLEFNIEKFSTMGNGYTFELESLLFYALSYALAQFLNMKPDITVYGDDIICPTDLSGPLSTFLAFCGFEVNSKKSFSSGPFRESCGGDYFHGMNIRPFYVKNRWTDARLVGFINYQRRGMMLLPESDLLEIEKFLDTSSRLYGPDGFGDGHIFDPSRTFLVPKHRAKGYSGYIFRTYAQREKTKREYLEKGDSLFPFYQVYLNELRRKGLVNSSFQLDPYVLSGSSGIAKVVKIYTLSQLDCFVSPRFRSSSASQLNPL